MQELERKNNDMIEIEKTNKDKIERLEKKFFEEKVRLQKETNKKLAELASKAHQVIFFYITIYLLEIKLNYFFFLFIFFFKKKKKKKKKNIK